MLPLSGSPHSRALVAFALLLTAAPVLQARGWAGGSLGGGLLRAPSAEPLQEPAVGSGEPAPESPAPGQAASDPDALWNAGRREAAVDALALELAAAPADRALRRRLAEWELSIHRYGAAYEHAAPLAPEGRDLRAVALFQLGRYDEALPLLDPTQPLECRMRLDALAALDRGPELEQALERASAVLGAEDSQRLVLRGQLRQRAGQNAEAAQDFRTALALDPLDLAALFGLGRTLLLLGEQEEGLQLLERHRALVPLVDRLDFARKSLDLAPRHGPNHAQLADVERDLGRIDRALEAYTRAGQLAEPDQVTPIALRHARCLAEDGADLDRALAVLDSAALRVDDARLHVRAGDLLRAAGRSTEAVEAYRRALALRPSDAAIGARLDRALAEAQR